MQVYANFSSKNTLYLIWIYFKQSMKLTVTDGNNFINLDVEPDQLIEDIKALIEY